MGSGGSLLISGEDRRVPGDAQAMSGRLFKEIRTDDGGACGVHALFGRRPQRAVHQGDASGSLRQKLGRSAGGVRRAARNCDALRRVVDRVWDGAVNLRAWREAGVRVGFLDSGH